MDRKRGLKNLYEIIRSQTATQSHSTRNRPKCDLEEIINR